MLRDLDKPASVRCPNCGKTVRWIESERWKPFCSERCRLVDLGEWVSEGHRIPGDPTTDEDVPPHDE